MMMENGKMMKEGKMDNDAMIKEGERMMKEGQTMRDSVKK